jgi:hypothetical protein
LGVIRHAEYDGDVRFAIGHFLKHHPEILKHQIFKSSRRINVSVDSGILKHADHDSDVRFAI